MLSPRACIIEQHHNKVSQPGLYQWAFCEIPVRSRTPGLVCYATMLQFVLFFFSSVRDRLKTSVWLFNFSQKVSALFCRNQTEVNVKHSLLQTCDCTRLNCQLLATGLLGKNFNKKPNSAKRPKRLFEGQKKQTFLWHCYYSFVTKKTSITRASLDFNFVISSGDHQQQAPGDGLLCPVVYVCTA